MQRGSMQGSGSSLERAGPRGEGGLRRQDGLPFPGIALHAGQGGMPGSDEAGGGTQKWVTVSWDTPPRLPGRWGTRPPRALGQVTP